MDAVLLSDCVAVGVGMFSMALAVTPTLNRVATASVPAVSMIAGFRLPISTFSL